MCFPATFLLARITNPRQRGELGEGYEQYFEGLYNDILYKGKKTGILFIISSYLICLSEIRYRNTCKFSLKILDMKSTSFILRLLSVLLIVPFFSCDDLTGDTGSTLRILPQQVLSANIDASGKMYFMPQMLMAEGGNPFHTYSWSLDMGSNPPSGVSIGAIDGIVTRQSTSGTGFSAGTVNFKVNVSDGNKTSSEIVGLHITNYEISPVADVQQLPVNEYQLINGKINQPYCASLFVMGGTPPFTWAIDSDYPSNLTAYGLSLDPIYGLISGTIPNSATPIVLSFKVVIRDSQGKYALFDPIYKITVN